MGFLRIWVHLVWTTKNRKPVLESSVRKAVLDHIRENARAKGIYIDTINGHLEHIHCLISLRASQRIGEIMMQLKGESSFWISRNIAAMQHFGWQDEYFAISVSESVVNRTRAYIGNQEEHHRKISFKDEYERLLVSYGFNRFASG